MHSTGSFNRDYLKVNIKMEEQTVPSAGFSPQPEYMTADYGSSPNYFGVGQQAAAPQQPQHYSYLQQQPHMHPHHHQHQQPNQIGSIGGNGCLDYSNLADSFDLSLLGDSYDDKDMATVPSPSSSAWSPLCGMETSANWQQISFYAASPSSCSDHSRAFSPDCAPAKSPFMSGKEEGISSYSTGAATPELSVAVNSPVEIKIEPEAQQSSTTAQSTSLIRQCLEDNSFLEKYNYKPLDLPILDANQQHQMDGSNGGTTLELNQIEPVFNLAYAQIISDMQNTCRTLAISPDPMQWSVGDVQSWLSYSLSSFSPERGASAIRALWNIDGQRLCSLTEDDFRVRDPLNGEKIFAKLELHKMLKCDGTSGNSNSVPATVPQQAGRDPLASSNNLDLGQILLAASAATSPAPPEISVVDMDMDIEGNRENGGVVSGVVPSLLHSNPASVENFSSSASSSSSMRHSDDEDDEEDEDKPATSSSSSASSPSATSSPSGVKGKASGTKNGAHIHLWQFLKELLASGQQHGSCIRWLDQSHGVFKIEDSVRVARLWGIRKNRPAMNYDKLSRSIRQYYRKGIMKKTERSQRLVYQFCPPYQL